MAKARAEQIIDRPADEVWGRVRDFVDVTWIPNTATSRLEGDLRIVTMHGRDVEVAQQLLHHDDENRTYSYRLATELDLSSILGPGHKVEKIEATLAVHSKGESTSWVTWDVETDDFLVESVRGEYQGALDNLKVLLEG